MAGKRVVEMCDAPLAAQLEGAERICIAGGLRLTRKRRQLLEALVRAGVPLSAYELADAYSEWHGQDLPVMTVYRMLDVFVEAGVVHKLRSTNRFLPCHHLACNHPHALAQFLICDSCGLVQEMDFGDSEMAQLDRKARATGFSLHREQLELHGVCDDCRNYAD
jgi:Fur family zinc uptake transcriptional regulator